MKKYLVTLIHNDTGETYQHEFEALDLDDAWYAVYQYCSQWNSQCVSLIKLEG